MQKFPVVLEEAYADIALCAQSASQLTSPVVVVSTHRLVHLTDGALARLPLHRPITVPTGQCPSLLDPIVGILPHPLEPLLYGFPRPLTGFWQA